MQSQLHSTPSSLLQANRNVNGTADSPDTVVRIVDNQVVTMDAAHLAGFAAMFSNFCAREHDAMPPIEVASNANRSWQYQEWVNGWEW